MARKSRRSLTSFAEKKEKKKFITGIYIRESVEEKQEIIENQKTVIEQFLKQKQDFQIYSVYIDNGWTGTNFKRPEFERLLLDIKKKKINCVIVKDLSRLGRNYIETEEYLENIFPSFSIRLIAVEDRYDSFDTDGRYPFFIHLQNIINKNFSYRKEKKHAILWNRGC